MSTHRIETTSILTSAERSAVRAFSETHRGVDALPELRDFLHREMGVELILDGAIVGGFVEDSSNLTGRADGLCRPETERDAAILLHACFMLGIPVTLSGGRSNLTGSATPEGGVVLSTVRLLTPATVVDAGTLTAAAPVGAILEEVRTAVTRQSDGALMFPVDPTSRADASLGGALSCNASGFTPGDVGAMRAWVQQLRFLLPDGRLIVAPRGRYVSVAGEFVLDDGGAARWWPVPHYVRPVIKNAGGPYSAPGGAMDFVDLVVGSEGLFGLVTACELRLSPRPADYLDLFFSLPSERQALSVLDGVRRRFHGELSVLSAFEYFGVNCRHYMDHEPRFFHGTDEVAMYIQQPLFGQTIDQAAESWMDLLAEMGEVHEDAILLLDSDTSRSLFLEARHSLPANALEVVQHHGTYTIMTDTVVPPARFEEFLEYTHGIIRDRGLDYLSFGHIGDCHLHFTLLPDAGQLNAGVDVYDAIVAKSAQLGGVYSGEHGTGKRKRKDFFRCYGQAAIDDLKACKRVVDPLFLLNRGNVFEAD